VKFLLNAIRPVRAVERRMPGGAAITAAPTAEGEIAVDVRRHWVVIRNHAVDNGIAELSGDVQAPAPGALKLRAVRRGSRTKLEFPFAVEGGTSPVRFTVRVPLDKLDVHAGRSGDDLDDRHGIAWDLYVVGAGGRYRVAVSDEAGEVLSRRNGREFSLQRTQHGDGSLVARALHAVVTEARWIDHGVLKLRGDHVPGAVRGELVLHNRHRLEHHVLPLGDMGSGRFEARLTPARVLSLAGELPLREGVWEMFLRPEGVAAADAAALVPIVLAPSLYEQLPLRSLVGHKSFALGLTPEQQVMLAAHRDLDDGERGGFHQRRLRETAYGGRRAEPLRDAIVYSSFGGRQYSDSPRAIHEELVRREAPLEHLWVVRDAMCHVPPTAAALRDGSREHYEALARARFIVTNDHFPAWFTRRPDQVCVQTWHGTPLKRLGFDMPEVRKSIRRAKQRWGEQAANWQYVLSPNRFSTPILRRAFAVEGEMLETGYPRADQLSRPDRDELGRRLRQRLGIPEGVRVVLYAPTYRDHIVDSRGRYRLDLHLDVERLRSAIGHDSIVLFRKHHRISDVVPATADGFVRDVSSYPDGTDLLLAADVLVTDYSSMMFDFANTGRPMLFFTYDLETYRDQVRGLYFDLGERAPGPLLRTTDDLAAALIDIDGLQARYAGRYAQFVANFCELDDGRASARVVDGVFMREIAGVT
jgi:CDP-glycerol glycerophosphotransferase